MKISEMSNDQACEAITRICGPIASLCEDEDVKKIMDEIEAMGKGESNPIAEIGRMLPRIVGFALGGHKGDLYEIVGALSGLPTAKVGALNFAQTVALVRESWDDIISGFFTSSAKAAKKNTEE